MSTELTSPHDRPQRDNVSFDDVVLEVSQLAEAGHVGKAKSLIAQHPEYSQRLNRLLPAIEALTTLDASSQHSTQAHQPQALGDFRIVREIGRGGMGVVYEAEQLSLSRRVAIKVLPFAAMLDQQQLKRFKNEARAAATLDHPNIVAVHSVGEERGVHYYAMQLVVGQSLAEVIAARREHSASPSSSQNGGESGGNEDLTIAHQSEANTPQVSIDTHPVAALSTVPNSDSQEYFRTVAQLGIQAAQALDHAHQSGIVHRDVKPGNLLLDTEGKLFVTDFGLARIEADAGMTMTGDLLGTLAYMSPEQVLAKRVVIDHRTDIYSLGVTLYELLTLQKPYESHDRQELLKRIAFDEPSRLRQINGRIPADLETIVGKAIEKSPDDRYGTVQELANDLSAFLENQPIVARPPTVGDRIAKWSRRHVGLVWTAACVVFVASALSTWLISNHLSRQWAIIASVEALTSQACEALGAGELALAQTAVGKAISAVENVDEQSPLRQQIVNLKTEIARFKQFEGLYRRARRREVEQAEQALKLYGVLENDEWLETVRASTAPSEHIQRVKERMYELLVLMAHDRVLWLNRHKEVATKLSAISEAREYLQKASKIQSPSKGYYWTLAACSQRMGDMSDGDVRAHHDAEALRLRDLAHITAPQNAAELFYICRDRRWGCASEGVRLAFRWPFATTNGPLAAYREMLRVEPQYHNGLFFSGVQYSAAEENFEAAYQAFRGCLLVDPSDSIALANSAICLSELGKHVESIADAQSAVEMARKHLQTNGTSGRYKTRLISSLLVQAGCMVKAGQLEEARGSLHEAEKVRADIVQSHPNLHFSPDQFEQEEVEEIKRDIESAGLPELQQENGKPLETPLPESEESNTKDGR